MMWIYKIVNHAYKKLGLIKKLKFTLYRNQFSKMHFTFVKPILEYASVVWDGCSISDTHKLEKVQLHVHAARIVTGLPILASKESIYFETGWEQLCERRRTAMLTKVYKMHTNIVPQYLCDTIIKKDNIILEMRKSI